MLASVCEHRSMSRFRPTSPLGLAFGTTSGDVWFSSDLGDRWHSIARHLPKIHNVTAGRLA